MQSFNCYQIFFEKKIHWFIIFLFIQNEKNLTSREKMEGFKNEYDVNEFLKICYYTIGITSGIYQFYFKCWKYNIYFTWY